MNAVCQDSLPTLPRGYVREAAVVEEICRLQGTAAGSLCSGLSNAVRQTTGELRPETLLYLLRSAARSGDEGSAWQVAEILALRVAGTAARYLSDYPGLNRDQRTDIFDDLLTDLYTEWLSDASEHAFWEVRFGLCLKRKLIDMAKRRLRRTQGEVTPAGVDADGNQYDLLESVQDSRSLSPEEAAVLMDGVAALPEPVRTAFFLYHHEGWTEAEIARHLSVTERSVRNYLRRAEQRLAAWRDEEG